jgi:energy-coupling factor transporter ATP-binding protein EcfA2
MPTGNPDSFPRDLLKAPTSERLNYFREFTTKHPLLFDAYSELQCAIQDSNPGSIIFLYGPTGVGKTTLLKRLVKHCKETLLTELENDTERIPIVKVRLPAPTSGIFDWKDYFQRLMLALEEPLVGHKLDRSQWDIHNHGTFIKDGSNMQLISYDKPGIRPMRLASERTLKHRRPVAVLIDDAQHLGIIRSGRKLLDQLNALKSLADETAVTHVLSGTYELIPLRNLNGQLSRRSLDIHFGRYHAGDEEQLEEFVNVLNTFQKHLPLPDEPDLASRWDYLYERSLGCVGVLKDWLTGSLALALRDDSSTLSLEYLEQRALSIRKCTTMLREIKTSEKELVEEEGGGLGLRQELGLTAELGSASQDARNAVKPSSTKSAGRRKRVGSRKPARDKIGVKAA